MKAPCLPCAPTEASAISTAFQCRKLAKIELGSIIFGCTEEYLEDCLTNLRFFSPHHHYTYLGNVTKGLPVFLFNFTKRELHGIYEAVGPCEEHASAYSSFPLQVTVRHLRECTPLTEDQFKPILIRNYYKGPFFHFELDRSQTSQLISLFEQCHEDRQTASVNNEDSDDVEDVTVLFAYLFHLALQGVMSIPDLILRLEEECRTFSESINREKARLLLDEAASWSLLWYLYGKEKVFEDSVQLCLMITQWLERLASKALDLEKKVQDESLLEDFWILLRAGRLEEARNHCCAAGLSWKVANLPPFGGMELNVDNDQQRIWKWHSYLASEQIALQDKNGKYAAAIYAANCSNVNRILPICTDWETACWALTKSWLDFQVDMHRRIHQNRNSDGASSNKSHRGAESWPLQVIEQQPHDLSALLKKLHSSESHEAVRRGCKEQHHQIEMSLMMEDIPGLVDLIWSWISPSGHNEESLRPDGDPHMIRFGAHLVLVLRHLLAKDSFSEKLMKLGDRILHMYAMFLFSKQHEELVGIYASQLARDSCIDLFVHMMELRLNSSFQVRYKIFLSAIEYLPFSPGVDSNGSSEKGSFEEIIERVLSRSREVKVGKYDCSTDVAWQSLRKAMAVLWLCFTPPSTIKDAKILGRKLLLRALMHSNVLFREFALISMRNPELPNGSHSLLSILARPLKDYFLSIQDRDTSDSLREFEDWNEYYACEEKYRSWKHFGVEENDLAMDTLASSMDLLLRKGNLWLVPTEDQIYDLVEPQNLELHATAMLCLSSGECMFPDATLCKSLTSALYSSVSDEDVSSCQLQVNVSISGKDSRLVEVALKQKDGFGRNKLADGGILAEVIAAGVKGELAGLKPGATIEIMRIDAWYSGRDGSPGNPATYILRGLCRRCCIPELILRCMKISVYLMEYGFEDERQNELVELVKSSKTGVGYLFSQTQFQEFLRLEGQWCTWKKDGSFPRLELLDA